MRSEQEMLDLILSIARSDERIRVVVMNGSRANPNAPRDFFQDFDIVFLVTDYVPFTNNPDWVQQFGEIMIMQMPEAMDDPPPANDSFFSYLLQFTDGNRIDLGIVPLDKLEKVVADSQSIVLLDKDERIGQLPPPSDRGYLPKPPTAKAFADCCNEFWWVCTYVAKGLWREEITYAKTMLDDVVRAQLMKMLAWYIGLQTQFLVNPGKQGKYFEKYLEPELWDMLMHTYAGSGYEENWQALFTMGELFRRAAAPLAGHYGFEYPFEEDRHVTAHLHHIRQLPRNAKTMY